MPHTTAAAATNPARMENGESSNTSIHHDTLPEGIEAHTTAPTTHAAAAMRMLRGLRFKAAMPQLPIVQPAKRKGSMAAA